MNEWTNRPECLNSQEFYCNNVINVIKITLFQYPGGYIM